MKTQIEKVSSLGRKLNVEIPAEIVTSTFNKVYQDFQKNAELKGFRKGKAPIHLIKSIYSNQVKSDTIQELLRLGISKGLQEHNLKPIDYPHFEFEEVIDGVDFTFSAHFEINPEVELKLYEGLELDKVVYTVDPKEIDSILENIRKSRAENKDLTEQRPAQWGDTATIDFKGFIEGKPLERGEGTDHPLELGSNSFVPGFEEGIVGMNINETKTLNLKFPENYHQDLSNKDVSFEVTLKKLSTKVLPELTDEFVTSIVGKESTLENLKSDIAKDLEERQSKKTTDTLKELLLKTLVTHNPVEIPSVHIREQKKLLIEDTQKKMEREGMSQEEYEEYKVKWDKDFENSAKEMLQIAYIIDAIAAKHKLYCTKEDLESKFDEFAQQTGIELNRIKEHYSKAESMDRLAHNITEGKVVDYLLSKAKIKEIIK